jgi:hypothetical protein
MLGGTGTDSTKIALGYLTLNLCFCIWWDLCVTLCIPVLLGCETSMHYFSYSNGTGTDSIKSIYTELVFFHLVGYACHVVHSGASEARNIDALFFLLGRDWSRFHKSTPSHYAKLVFLHLVAYVSRCAVRSVRGVKR